MSDKALLALQITMSAPDAPECFSLRDDFPRQAADQVRHLLERTWPMMKWDVDVKGTTQ